MCSSVQTPVVKVRSGGSIWERVEQLLMFNNKLRMSLRSLYSVQSECNSLKHKVNTAVQQL